MVLLLEETSRMSTSTLKNGEENLTAQSMYYILNTKTIFNQMWEIFTSHTWTGTYKESCLKQDRDRTDSNMQAVTVDGFMRIIKHISAPRYTEFNTNIINQLMGH